MNAALGAEAEVGRISRAKAEAVCADCGADALIIAADTIVCVDEKILGV